MGRHGHRIRRGAGALVLSAALLSLPALAAAPAAADEASWLYDPNTVVAIDLGLGQLQIQELEAEPDEYVKGSFEARVGGQVRGPVLSEVGIRLKGGAGSFQNLEEKPAFKVKFDKYVKGQRYFGLEKLTLNNMVQDPSMIHEAMAYDLFRSMGVPAPRTGYAFTRLNGEVIGIHADIETYDKVSLPRLFTSTRHMYEADTFDVDVVPGGAGAFEVDEGDDEDLGDLEALIAAANDDAGDWSDGMAAVADLAEMTRMWAVERYIGHWDGYAGGAFPTEYRPNNYYLHSLDTGVFEMAPWGTDQTWDTHLMFDEPAGGLLFNECFDDDSCRTLYDQALDEIQDLVPALEFPRKARRYLSLLDSCRARESDARRPYTEEEVADEVETTLTFIDERHIPLDEYLGSESPPPGPEVGNPPTEEPCGADPGLEAPAQAPGPDRPVPGTPLGFGPTRVHGSRISTVITVPGPGTASQRIGVHVSRKRWRPACRDTEAAAGPGTVTVSCRLAAWARELHSSRSLRLRVRLRFDRAGAPDGSLSRRITVPARG